MDAHFPSGADFNLGDYCDSKENETWIPLEKELQVIKEKRPNNLDVIIIDDLCLFDESYQPKSLPEGVEVQTEALASCEKLFKKSHHFLKIKRMVKVF